MSNEVTSPKEEANWEAFKEFKHKVYHVTTSLITKSIEGPSKFGVTVQCENREVKILFPTFLYFSGNLEER